MAEEYGWDADLILSQSQCLDDFNSDDDDVDDKCGKRFGDPVTSSDVDKAIANAVPEQTRRQTNWCVSVYKSWCEVRGESSNLSSMSASAIEEQLCRFVMEARRQDGKPYPPRSVYAIITGLQRYLRNEGRREVAFLSESDPTYARLRLALDARMKELTSSGVGAVTKQAEPLSEEHERMLWEKGIFTTETGMGLCYIVFFYNCKLFGLRGGDEHRGLMREQFSIDTDSVGRFLSFVGRASKNVKGGLKQRSVNSKNLKIYAKPEKGSRCIVDIYSCYFEYIPPTGPFYRKPLSSNVSKIWNSGYRKK